MEAPHNLLVQVRRFSDADEPQVAEAHRRLEAGGPEGKLVLCADLPSRCDRETGGGPPAETRTRLLN